MAKDKSFVHEFQANLDNKLGTVLMGNEASSSISGHGYKWPFGQVLIVPDLANKVVLSVGMLEVSDYTLTFANGTMNMYKQQ